MTEAWVIYIYADKRRQVTYTPPSASKQTPHGIPLYKDARPAINDTLLHPVLLHPRHDALVLRARLDPHRRDAQR